MKTNNRRKKWVTLFSTVIFAITIYTSTIPLATASEMNTAEETAGKTMIEVASSSIPVEIRHVLMDESYYEANEPGEGSAIFYEDCCKYGHALKDEFSIIKYYVLSDFLSPFTEGLPPEELIKQDYLLSVSHSEAVNPVGMYYTLNDRGEVRSVFVYYIKELQDYGIRHDYRDVAFGLYDFLTSEAVIETEQGRLPVQNLYLFSLDKGWEWAAYCETDAGVYVQCVGYIDGQRAPCRFLYTLEEFTEQYRVFYDLYYSGDRLSYTNSSGETRIESASKLSFLEFELYKPTRITKSEYTVQRAAFDVVIAALLVGGAVLPSVVRRRRLRNAGVA